MTLERVEQRMALVNPALHMDTLSDVDLAIKAVFESMQVKRDVFGLLGAIANPWPSLLPTHRSLIWTRSPP